VSNQPRAAGRPGLQRFTPLASLSCALLICITSCSCGKVGAPVPPSRITQRTRDLKAVQRGSAVFLSWPSPTLVGAESSRDYIASVEIYRLRETKDQEPLLDPDDYEAAADRVGDLDRQTIEVLVKSFGGLQYADSIDFKSARDTSNLRLRYAVRYINARGQKSAFSNSVAVEPLSAVAAPPTNLHVEASAQDEVKIEWTPPDSNVDGTRPASVTGYNIYRRAVRREAFTRPLNSEPLTESHFTDTRFQYKLDYVYVVRALSQGAVGLIESADSEQADLTPVDTFAPAAPDPVSIASVNGVISLFWPTSIERDVVGYNIYRAESSEEGNGEWTKLTVQPLSNVTAYRDDRVVIGKRYSYRVAAVDRFGNESAPSHAVSETANP
jgi:fibronectin type 3 domain-containing protein